MFLACLTLPLFILTPPLIRAELPKDGQQFVAAHRFQELEDYASQCRAEKLEATRAEQPSLKKFYNTLVLLPKQKDDTRHLEFLNHLESWKEAFPYSITPRVTLFSFYISFAWKARGGGWAREVTEEGWKVFRERLARARTIFEDADRLQTKDPELYARAITLAMGQSWPRKKMESVYEKGITLFPHYFPLHVAKRYYLAKKWHGDEGDWQIFAQQAADRLGGEAGDSLYARLVLQGADEENDNLFKLRYADIGQLSSSRHSRMFNAFMFGVRIGSWRQGNKPLVDYARVKRGGANLCARLKENWWYRNRLAYVACLGNDRELALPLMCAIAYKPDEDTWDNGGKNCWEKWLAWADDRGHIARGRNLEKQGKWDEAEKCYASLPTPADENRFLDLSRYRHGMVLERQGLFAEAETAYLAISEKWRSRNFILKNFHFTFARADKLTDYMIAERGQRTPETTPPEKKYNLMLDYLLLRDFDQSKSFGAAFNKERPWNLGGYATLYAIALHQGDAAAIEDLRNRTLAIKTNRKAYLYAQSLMKGEKSWNGPTPELDPKDLYFRQSVFMIALDYQYQKKPDLRDAILKYALDQLPADTIYFPNQETQQLASLLYGGLRFTP
ncbi:MAG: DUF4034 domain-containing protein [Verrucomicrobiae bacterium]|nr:DUF4034 domain-containing protein [Verrucomicrobiae bacterium]